MRDEPVRSPTFHRSSLLAFVAGAVLLRILAIVAWAIFPGTEGFQQIARVLIPLSAAAGLFYLNQILLRRDGFPPDVLGLHWRRFGWFFAGGTAAIAVVLLISGVFWVFLPFHWERGALSWTRFGWQFLEYSAGNSAEELIFRSYLLLLIARHFGTPAALGSTALLFGLFHLPGLSGSAALKMMCTTGAWAFLFAYAFLLTRSLWTAIGLHVCGNLFLHQALGMSGGASLLTPVQHSRWPEAYDPGFLAWMIVSVSLACVAGWWFRKRQLVMMAPP